MSRYKAFKSPEPTLETSFLSDLCRDHVNGACRRSTCPPKCHIIQLIKEKQICKDRIYAAVPNYLLTTQRVNSKLSFEEDGPGVHALLGVRHDNDHPSIIDITILPTTDEILCGRQPYMPSKIDSAPHLLPHGPERLLDIHFRHLRHENVAQICDVFYDAMQVAVASNLKCRGHRSESASGQRYSLFQNARFESLLFDEKKGAVFRLSYDCPPEFRQRKMLKANILKEGMLCGIVAVHEETHHVNVVLYQVHLRESTDAMRTQTGNHLRASVQVCMVDNKDTTKICQSTCYAQGIYKAKYFIVDLPTVLPAAFMHHLERLQALSIDGRFAFKDQIAPTYPGLVVDVQPPEPSGSFYYNLNCLKKDRNEDGDLFMDPQPVIMGQCPNPIQQELKTRTTLDDGQATALHENLNRKLALTIGPPGTGKTYLGVKEIQVILNSRHSHRKPVVVVCMTNHALDDFILSLKDSGITNIARLGGGSSAKWITPHLMTKIRSKVRRSCGQTMQFGAMKSQLLGLRQQGIAFANSLSSGGKDLWMMLSDYFRANELEVYEHFVRLDSLERERPNIDIRQALMFQGFAFMFWLEGGDIQDVDGLIDAFEVILGKSEMKNKFSSESEITSFKAEISADITESAGIATATGDRADLWMLDLRSREKLALKWYEDANPHKICEAFAEIHRRHQDLLEQRNKLFNEHDREALEESKTEVIGLTSTGCARYWELLNSIQPRVVIFEEASELTEAHSICALVPSITHCIQIGDPLQLRPHVQQMQLSMDNDSRYRLDESLFERLISIGVPFSKLNTQRRAHPEMADLLRAGDYPYLIDHQGTKSHPPVSGLLHRMYWYDHGQPEDTTDPKSETAKSFSNKFEVDFIYAMVKYLVLVQGYKFHDITILTPYNGQIVALKDKLAEICSVSLTDADRNALIDAGLIPDDEQAGGSTLDIPLSSMLRIATVDNYQGEQARVILFSAVRSNHNNSAGFLKNHNRLNVAISRAEDGFYVVGNSRLVSVSRHWAKVVEVFRSKKVIGDALPICCACHGGKTIFVRQPSDFQTLPICTEICLKRLTCGHVCRSQCHPVEMHRDGRLNCSQKCFKTLDCGHSCKKLCGEPCGPCNIIMEPADLPCGHTIELACDSRYDPVVCTHIIEHKELKCGHFVAIRCFEDKRERQCREACGIKLDCGHACLSRCTKCSTLQLHPKCTVPCGKLLACTHSCKKECHLDECPPCKQPCLKGCRHGACKEDCCSVCDPCVEEEDTIQTDSDRSEDMRVICALSVFVQNSAVKNTEGARQICDLLYGKCGEQMAKSFHEVTIGEELIFLKFDKWCKEITTGPLSGRLNQQLLSERGQFMVCTQQEGTHFRDAVVIPIQNSILKVYEACENSMSLPKPVLSFKLRFDLIYLHSRMVMNLFGHNLIKHLRTLKMADQHTMLLAKAVGLIIVEHSKGEVEDLGPRITECKSLNLKRLEVEMRIMQLCFWMMLQAYDGTNKIQLDVNESLARIRTLIDEYPHTAGLFKDGYRVIAKSVKEETVINRLSDVFQGPISILWAQWGKHRPGTLSQCKFGHPFSTEAFLGGCPECGEEKEDPYRCNYDPQIFLRHFGLA